MTNGSKGKFGKWNGRRAGGTAIWRDLPPCESNRIEWIAYAVRHSGTRQKFELRCINGLSKQSKPDIDHRLAYSPQDPSSSRLIKMVRNCGDDRDYSYLDFIPAEPDHPRNVRNNTADKRRPLLSRASDLSSPSSTESSSSDSRLRRCVIGPNSIVFELKSENRYRSLPPFLGYAEPAA